MASEFQRSKVVLVFGAMDATGDGYLTEEDFRLLAGRWAGLRGGDEKLLSQVMLGWWTMLQSAAGGADRVTLDDVLNVVDVLPDNIEPVIGTADAMFGAVDADGDDYVSEAEYRVMVEAWLGRAAATDFAVLDLDGDGRLSRAEFATLWAEFWAGDDADAAGSYVFGPVHAA
ncbi:EF hand [Lentzea albidocapillata subsp. violacea]|uniref:EF hand n=1 Tax=Lentzea albidocapillata subsp. violacea TaxID=128104 RepID=A0A1G9EZT9_9PSEU|nr:EF-hand domain-containing protein [Lentzea albidocapillata]SDK81553.1 EF hand [Lentzea albidocapillata subsp. violacea]